MTPNTEDNRDAADRFLRDGLPCFVPAIRALNTFIEEIERRIREVLEPHDDELNALGIASSTSKLSFSPKMGQGQLEQEIQVGVRNPDRSGFYIYTDLTEEPSRSLYVGFWLWTPVAQERRELFGALQSDWGADGYEIEQDDELTVYIGKYVSQVQHFPRFEPLLDKLVQQVILGLKKLDFVKRFGSGFRKGKSQLSEPVL